MKRMWSLAMCIGFHKRQKILGYLVQGLAIQMMPNLGMKYLRRAVLRWVAIAGRRVAKVAWIQALT